MITYCRNCGANLEPGATRCRRCGAEISEMPEEEPSFGEKLKEKLKGSRVLRNALLVAAAFLVLLAAAGIASALNSRSGAPEPAEETPPAQPPAEEPSPSEVCDGSCPEPPCEETDCPPPSGE